MKPNPTQTKYKIKKFKGWVWLRTIASNKMVHYPDYYEQQRKNEMKIVERLDMYAVDIYVPEGEL